MFSETHAAQGDMLIRDIIARMRHLALLVLPTPRRSCGRRRTPRSSTPETWRSAMDELDEDELFTVCLDDDGHPVLRTVADMTAGEVIAAIDHLTVEAAGRRVAVREKLARLLRVVEQKHPSLRDPV
jgi:hypothetical protein